MSERIFVFPQKKQTTIFHKVKKKKIIKIGKSYINDNIDSKRVSF